MYKNDGCFGRLLHDDTIAEPAGLELVLYFLLLRLELNGRASNLSRKAASTA